MRKSTADADLREFSRDAGTLSLTPKVVYFAETEDDVVKAMREASVAGLPVTPRGGGTGIPTQSVGRGAILLQPRRLVEVRSDHAICHPGVVKAELNKALMAADRWMPVDPSSYASCTVGGMVANNSSGIRTPKYGSTIDYVLGLRVAFADGETKPVSPMPAEEALHSEPRTRKAASLVLENISEIMDERPNVTKNSSGYRLERVVHDGVVDLPRLFVGSEGTLGVLTEATLGIKAPPKWRLLFIVESTQEELDATVQTFRDQGPTAVELVDKSVFRKMDRWDEISKYSRSESPYLIFCEFDGSAGDSLARAEELSRSGVSRYDPIVLTGPAEIQEAWEARNETLRLAQDFRKGSKILVPGVEDLVVHPSRLGDLVKILVGQYERRGMEFIMYGHAGDANLHTRPLLDLSDSKDQRAFEEITDELFEAVWKMKGSITGEHGDGMLRAKYVHKQYPRTYWIMKELKDLYDPKKLLNPGVKVV